MRKSIVILIVLTVVGYEGYAKKHKTLSKVLTLKIEHRGGLNGAAVAWDPVQQKYYAAIAGNTYYPMGVYNSEGKRVGDTTTETMFDVRGLWYNTSTKTIQSNGYKDFGMAEYVMDNNGIPESVKKLKLLSKQPSEQSAGAYDTGRNVLYFYEQNSANIIREDLNGAADTVVLHLGIKKKRKIKAHNNSEVKNYYNENTCVYSGVNNAAIGLLNVKEKQVELYNPENGLLKKVLKLPADAPADYSLNFSCSNGIYWFFDKKKREWRGYQ